VASNLPESVGRGDAPTTVIISSVLAILLATLIGAGALVGRPSETLSQSLTAIPIRAAAQATIEAEAKTAAALAGTSVPRATPAPAVILPTPTGPPPEPDPGNIANGRRLFASLACNSCHAIPGISTANTCPPLGNVGNLAATRKPGYTPGQYIAESIINTNAYVVQGFQPNVMPQTFATLPQNQINDLVAFLLAQKAGQSPRR
jgi:hypothetical protein